MKFSVITVCKNARGTMERTLRSVAAQTYRDLEYLVVDGASTDGTQAIVEAHRAVVTRFVSEPDAGIYAAMNKGVRAATGDYLYFLNADDYLADPDVLADVARFLTDHPACDLVYGDLNVVRRNGELVLVKSPPPERALEYLITGCLPHQGSFARAETFRTVGLFDERYRYAADYDWFLRLMQRDDARVYYYPRLIGCFATGGASSTQVRQSTEEMFAVQDRAPVYQSNPWPELRLRKYQEAIVTYRQMLALSEREDLVHLLCTARNRIAFMQGSKFWALRGIYLALRRGLASLWRKVFPHALLRGIRKRVGW